MMGPTDIIDDLKSAVSNKFPNSLARYFDPADIQIQLRTQSFDRQQQTRRFKPSKANLDRVRSGSISDDNRAKLPVGSSLDLTGSSTYVTLEPDQVVWEILDEYFPGGMSMSDAFIITVESRGTSDNMATDRHSQLGQEEFDYSRSDLQSPQQPWPSSNRMSPMGFNVQQYHNPRPQQPIPIKQNTYGMNRSVSPNLLGSRSPPWQAPHKRSQSNPPQSPVSSSSFSHQAKSGNSQAVLLLPKNFSLGEQNTLKRYSIDETTGNNGSAKAILKLKQSVNVTNIGNDASPSSGLTFEIPAKDVHNLNSDKESLDSREEGLNSKLPHLDLTTASVSGKRQDSDEQNEDKERTKNKASTEKPKETTINMSTFEKVLPQISVLVVEDNSINQAILGAFLRRHKIHYEIAKNGQEAVDKWRKGGFHLVLMDIQLPVKSGIEATKEIRHLEKVNKIGVFAQHELANGNHNSLQLKEVEKLDLNIFRSPVIIVALTASSNSSVDKKNALTAGCNDFLTKPVNLVWLQNKITEWGCMQALIDFDAWRVKGTPQGSVSKRGLASGDGKNKVTLDAAGSKALAAK